MNIEVLMAGARLGGPRSWIDTSPSAWTDMAVAHAKTVAKNHVRPDGSTYHVVEYNPVRGTVNKRYTYQVRRGAVGRGGRSGRRGAAQRKAARAGRAPVAAWAGPGCRMPHQCLQRRRA